MFHVRKLGDADAAALRQFRSLVLPRSEYELEVVEMVQVHCTKYVASPASPIEVFGAVNDADSALVGVASLQLHQYAQPVGYLGVVAVATGWHGRGICRALMDHVMSEARSHGATVLHSMVHEANGRMIDINRRLGADFVRSNEYFECFVDL
jgi:GNAT superfamily N-acetyltransferase